MDVSIITVTWNSKELIGRQIESVFLGCNTGSCEEIVIDNASTDGTAIFVQDKFPQVTVIANTENKGFGAANNQGLAVATGEYLLFLNPDMRVEPGSIDSILAWMKQRPDVGIVSPKLIDEHGKINEDAKPRRFPKLHEQIALLLKLPHVFPHIMDRYHMKDFDADKEQEVDSVRGSFMLMRRDMVEKLGWAYDPRYYIWYEDVDICREAKRLGYKVVHTPIISCVDYVGQSFKKQAKLFWKQNQFTKSMLMYFKKWEPWYVWMWIALLRPFVVGAAWMHDKIKRI